MTASTAHDGHAKGTDIKGTNGHAPDREHDVRNDLAAASGVVQLPVPRATMRRASHRRQRPAAVRGS
jgi:hypothetical protein